MKELGRDWGCELKSSWNTIPYEMMDPCGSYESHQITSGTERAIPDLLKLIESYPDGAERAIETLYNIASTAIKALGKAEEIDADAFRRFAGYKTKWPHMLEQSKGWVKSRMPEDVRRVLYDMGLGETGMEFWEGKDDPIGISCKHWFSVLISNMEYPDYWHERFSIMEPGDGLEPTDEYIFYHFCDLPALENKSSVLREWAKAIFELIFLDIDFTGFGTTHLRGYKTIPDRSDLEAAGVGLIELPKGTSELFDRNSLAYSLFWPCSESFLSRAKTVENKNTYDEAKEIAEAEVYKRRRTRDGEIPDLDDSPLEDFEREEVKEFAKKLVDANSMQQGVDPPSDEVFKENAVNTLANRLTTFAGKRELRRKST